LQRGLVGVGESRLPAGSGEGRVVLMRAASSRLIRPIAGAGVR